jgi:hypothetical protein
MSKVTSVKIIHDGQSSFLKTSLQIKIAYRILFGTDFCCQKS